MKQDNYDLIKQVMELQGIGVREMARRIGKDHPHVIRTLKSSTNPTLSSLEEILDVLGLELIIVSKESDK